MHIGNQSIQFENKIYITSTASVVGKKEGEGPLCKYYDVILEDEFAGEETWEKAESRIVQESFQLAVKKSQLHIDKIDYIISGDLLNQSIGSTFGVKKFGRPFFGVYGACSTMGESMSLASIIIDSKNADNILVGASSHFCAAEKQFRFPLELGTQRPLTATWTVTGAGACVLSKTGEGVHIDRITTGKIIDMGINDASNMGAAMAPAAASVIMEHLKDFNITPDYYDLIITGDLGYVGHELMLKLLKKEGIEVGNNFNDCGKIIFDKDTQDTHSGGSGCACSAVTFAGVLYEKLKNKQLQKILFIPTGALLSTTSVQQGNTIPAIAHAVSIKC